MSAETRAALAASTTREQRLQAAATDNLKLQVVDLEYATRAGANNAHFHLPRTGDDVMVFVRASVAEGAPLNAVGLYAQYHVAALALAQQIASGAIPPAGRDAAARDVILLEGYALHWLEDIFASGHAVGTWGSAAWRKGTHDRYNEFGSVQLEFPVLEWTPFRTFATQEVLYPVGAPFSTGPSRSIWLRGVFDGRCFLGSREDLQAPR